MSQRTRCLYDDHCGVGHQVYRQGIQAASLWTCGIRADWSVIDPVILHKAIASQ